MMQVKNERLEKTHNIIQMNMDQIINAIDGIPLFGAVGSSIALNLANKNSDVDFYLITQGKSDINSEVKIKEMYLAETKFDFVCVSLNELIWECENYCAMNHRYPTRFYRDQQEADKVKQSEDTERPDFKREMVMRIYLADTILEFESGAAAKYYGDLKKGCLLIDIWDSHFNRAYGNYFEKIKNRDSVLLRKYLYTISELTICRLLMERNEKPVMDFKHMFTYPYCPYTDSEIVDICNKLWERNRKATLGKEKCNISPIIYLNQWIEEQIEELLNVMRKQEDFLRNTYLLPNI